MAAELVMVDAAAEVYPFTMRVSLVRDADVPQPERPEVASPSALGRMLVRSEIIPDDGREHFGVVLLDARHRLCGVVEVSVGCLTSSLVHPRNVFAPALVGSAAAIAVYHNHPSGDPEPSAEDIALTRRLAAAGTLLGIELLDHVVVGSGSRRFVSLKERGIL